MSKPQVLITGACGEVGHSLIQYLADEGQYEIIATDRNEPPGHMRRLCKEFLVADILDRGAAERLKENHRFSKIFHLAGLLSAYGERFPFLAHEVNVNGSMAMLDIAAAHGKASGVPVVFVFTSSIAVYGVPVGVAAEHPLKESEFNAPTTMYGLNKRYIEEIGTYLTRARGGELAPVDFRSVRFPGLISPDSLPSGGTSDYGPEMLHAAASGKPYRCFVNQASRLPFMLMSDAVRALVLLSKAQPERLSQRVYNVTSFSVRADEIAEIVRRYFPAADLGFEPVAHRQAIVDSWPRALNDQPARRDWDWSPNYDLEAAFEHVLVPKVRERYAT